MKLHISLFEISTKPHIEITIGTVETQDIFVSLFSYYEQVGIRSLDIFMLRYLFSKFVEWLKNKS